MALQVLRQTSPHLLFLLPYSSIFNPSKPAPVITILLLLVKATVTLHCFIQHPYLRLDLSPLVNMGLK